MSDINEIPESFNKSLLEKALLEYTDDPSLQLIDYKIIDNAKEISYHFSSIMFKVELEYKRPSVGDEVYHLSAIVKTLPDSPDQSHNTYLESVRETAQFDTELNVYDKILPKIELMLNGTDMTNLAPRQIYQTNAPVPILIMEDMTVLGYTTIKDRSQISFDSARILIGKLAQFHATSFVLNKQMDETVAQLKGVSFDYYMDKSYCEAMDKCIEMMKKFNGFEQIVAKLEGSTERIFDTVRDVYYSQNDAACKVLCHGDMKFENTLIKTNENGIEDGVFVDFANANLNTPAIDLFEFLYKVPALDVIIRKDLRDELINHYLDVFSAVLAKTSVEDIIDEIIQNVKNEIHRCNVLQVWFVMFLVVYKLKLFDQESDADIDVLNYEEKWLKTVLDELTNANDE